MVKSPAFYAWSNLKMREINYVRYFLVKDSDGTIRGAVDLCVKLHPPKSGWMLYKDYYVLCKDEMCVYPIVGIGTSQPGCCKPIALPVELDGDNVRISTEYLEDASQYFWMGFFLDQYYF